MDVEIENDAIYLCATTNNSKSVSRNSEKFETRKGFEINEMKTAKNRDVAEEMVKKVQIGCRICDKKIFRISYYEKHWDLTHKNVHPSKMYENPLQCKICRRYLQNKHSLKCHMGAMHKNQFDLVDNENFRFTSPGTGDQRLCHICRLVVSDYYELIRHSKKVHGWKRASNIQLSNASSDAVIEMIEQVELEANCLNKDLKPVESPDSNYISEDGIYMVLQPFEMYQLIPCDSVDPNQLQEFTLGERNESIPKEVFCNVENCKEIDKNVEKMPIFKDTKWNQCWFCKVIVIDSNNLKAHLVVYHNYVCCPICDFASQTISLTDHLETAHLYKSSCPIEEAAQQYIIDAEFRLVQEKNGMKESSARPKQIFQEKNGMNESSAQPKQRKFPTIFCRVCGMKYNNCRDYRTHFLNYHPEHNLDERFENGWKCKQCSDVFQNLKGLQFHWINKHKEIYNKEMFNDNSKLYIVGAKSDSATTSVESVLEERHSIVDNESSVVCIICDMMCVDNEQLLLHACLAHQTVVDDF